MRRNRTWKLRVSSFSLPELSKKSKQLLQPFSDAGFVTLSKHVSQILTKAQPNLSKARRLGFR